MNIALRHWKEAATVILAAGKRHNGNVDVLKGSISRVTTVPSANCPLGLPPKSAFDYEVLLLKRSGKSGFMPNAYVFPGGLVDSSDFSNEWLDIFKPFVKAPNFGLGVVRQSPDTRPPIFSTNRVKLGSQIPGDVAFRICAIRETFEESGVLLVVPKKEQDSIVQRSSNKNEQDSNTAESPLTVLSGQWSRSEIAKWRMLVVENPSNFIKMCKELECLPNIWALHEWGNWLTPTGVYGKQRRYDTAFYICCLQETPHTVQDEKEIVHFKWSTPSEVLHSYQAREMWIAPPQFYDLRRICRFPELQKLHNFSRQRSLQGCEQWLAVRLISPNFYISLLPGDGLYPDNVNDSGHTDINMRTRKSLRELEEESSRLHRIVCHDPYTSSVQITITPKYGHVAPLSGPVQNDQSEHGSSKL
ncbi:acyl-coenzyme A diphosphatase NUDT19 [Chanos chanos]|uniref:Acyl-coenzyme A diphosphatase NUDT19 n=1 Tax=Chanos chanos TaxID=29144 RepID=A0A6J2US79_CHACN|nr:nucleoside diphosphate-linked moiety X motif 19 [Chanos chanos]